MSLYKSYREMIRPFDIIMIIVLALFSFIPVAVFVLQQRYIAPDSEIIAVVSINGSEVDRFVLEEDTPHQLITYTTEHGLTGDQYNIIELDGLRIRVMEDNSPDQIAVQTSWISRPGQTSICLPHRLIIRIEAANPDLLDDPEIIIAG